jgi:hypothetical protein
MLGIFTTLRRKKRKPKKILVPEKDRGNDI